MKTSHCAQLIVAADQPLMKFPLISFKHGGGKEAQWHHFKFSFHFYCFSEDTLKPLHLKEVTAEGDNKQP